MSVDIAVERANSSAPRDIFDQVAEIHLAEINEGFLATLGSGFLKRLYRALAESPHAFLLIAMERDVVVGFICGGTDTAKVYRSFMMRWGVLILPSLLPKLFSFHRMKRIVETLLYPSKEEVADLPKPEILNFCVSSKHQRKGVGRLLFIELVKEFQSRGISRIRIVTGKDQRSAQGFYESLGAEKVAEFEVHEGTASLVYVYDLDRAQSGSLASEPTRRYM
jgi:ribosomal protein S18 acetylase RimI-like enzyme